MSRIILRERNAAPEDKAIFACWTGAWQALSIILKLTAAAVLAITLEAVVAKILISPRRALPNTFDEICY